MKIDVINNHKYFVSLDLQIDHTRRDAYFIIDRGEYNVPGSYKRYQCTGGKTAFKKFDEWEKILFDKYGIK